MNVEHDPLCMNKRYNWDECNCTLIVRVRADERSKAAQRVAELGCRAHDDDIGCLVPVERAIAAAQQTE